MDRNDDMNPGMVERQLDEMPMEGHSASDRESMPGMEEREGLQGDGSVEREGMQDGGGTERESLTGRESEQLGAENMNSNDAEMRTSGREGGYGYDRPTDMTVTRDTMEGSSRTADQGTDRAPDIDRSPDQPRGTTTARDW
ncbi:MAG TPA: hypothetical protein VFS20_19565 [Longimicrobium sp.]|nr:hypothetical protein [Longimicrobium sp.]